MNTSHKINDKKMIIRNRIATVGYEVTETKHDKCKLGQKEYKSRHNWMGKMIIWELCKKLKFNYITTWYVQKAELLKNETHKILEEFEIQMGLSIPAKKPDLMIINMKDYEGVGDINCCLLV